MYGHIKVYGIRICPVCKGICHENSWRTNFKNHNTYFCSESHLRAFINDKLIKELRKHHPEIYWDHDEHNYTDEEYKEYRDTFYEQVDIITP